MNGRKFKLKIDIPIDDAGIITLPDGSHLAISIFVSDSNDSQTKREMTIAKAAKVAYDYWNVDK